MFTTSIIYQANLEATESIVVNQGGTSSGKTYSIIQLLFTLAIACPMQVITVVGQDIPNLKKGAYRDAKTIYSNSKDLQQWFGKPNETDRVFTCTNGSIIEFTSYQDEQDAKSGKRDYLFVNEANGISYDIYRQLAIRTRKKIFIDYNPSASFWVHEELIGKEGVKLIISDHRHNPFLTQEQHDKIEGISDPDYWKVYARGLTGKIEGLLFPVSDLRFESFDYIDFTQAVFAFSIGDPADKGGDFYAMPFCFVMCNENDLSVFVKEVIFNKDGIEANTETIRDKVKANNIEQVFIESNGGWVSSAILLKNKLSNQTKVTAYSATVNKMVRMLSNYEFIKRHFVFDKDYKSQPDYKAFIANLTTIMKEGKNKNDDSGDALAAAANIVKIKYKKFLYG